jgi:hypothetical protein
LELTKTRRRPGFRNLSITALQLGAEKQRADLPLGTGCGCRGLRAIKSRRAPELAARHAGVELGHMGEPPTKDYLSWKGERFRHSRKNRIPSEKTGQGVRRNRTVVSEESGHLTGELSEESGHTADIPCPNKPDISRITIWVGAGGSSIGEPGGGITATSSQAALLLGPVIVSRTSGHANGSVDGGPAEGQCERCGKAAPLWQIKLGPGKHPPRYCRSCRQWWFRFRCRRNDGAEARI